MIENIEALNGRHLILTLLLGCCCFDLASAQDRIGKIDVTLMLERLPEALAMRAKFHKTRVLAHRVLEMQIGGLLVAAYPEVPTSPATNPEAFATFFPRFKAEVRQRSQELYSWLIQREAAMLKPLMAKVDSAIEAVRIEMQLDTILRTEACPFDLWAENKFLLLNQSGWRSMGGLGWEWHPYVIVLPAKAPCLSLGTVLATAPDVRDIAPQVLKRLNGP